MERCGLLDNVILGCVDRQGHNIASQNPAEAASKVWHSGTLERAQERAARIVEKGH